MNYAHHYKLRDYRFSRWLVTLRKKVGLTQEEVAGVVGVSEKAVRNWESGMSYPTPVNLKKLVEIYLHRGAFLPGQEQAEAKALWEQAYEHSARFNEYFDGDWFTAVYKQQSPDQPPSLPSPIQPRREDWGEAIDVSSFYGREQEIAELERWLLIDKCRLVVLLGMGGIGKTVLSVKFARQAASHFDFIFWRSLHNAPSLREILVDCVLLLSDQQYTDLPHDPEKLISMLVELLRQHHCLLILDNVETVLQGGNLAGRYREGYEGYEALFQRLAEVEHRSCLLLTSREMLQGLEHLEGMQAPVRVLKIASLDLSASRTMLKEKLLFGEEEIWLALVRRYGGNPLALKIVAEVVREVFGGDITAFLREEHVTFKSIRLFLDQQFERLSVLEQNMMYWLAIERDLVPLDTLSANFMHAVPRGELLEALTSLRWRSLLERGEQGAVFTLQPVVLEYVTERLTEHIGEEIISKKPALLLGFALMKSQVKEYIQNSQVRLIVQPILDKLMTRFGSKQRIEQGLMDLADWLREQPFAEQGYGGGNMVNLLVSLNGNVRGQNFSHLVIRQAYLQGVEAQDADFVGSDLIGSVFTETFGGISSVALSRDGKYVATGGFNGQIRLWMLADGKLLLTQPGHIRMVWSLAFSPDGKLLASSGYDGHVKLWEVNSGQCLRVLDGHTNWAMSVAFSSDGHTLVTCGKDGSIRLWEVRDGTGLKMWSDKRGAIYSVAFSPNGLLASGSEDGEVRLWEIATGQCLQRITAHPGGGVFSIAFHHEGNIFASAGADGEVKVWEVNSGQCLKILRGHTKTVTSVVFGSADILASGSHDATVKLWEVSSGRCLTTLHGHNNMIWSIDLNPAGILVSGGHDSLVKMWQVDNGGASGQYLRTLQGYSSLVSALAFSPDGSILVSGDDNGTIRLWAMQGKDQGRCLRTLQGHVHRVHSVVFSPGGNILASSADDGDVTMWDVRSGQSLRTLRGHNGSIWSVVFSPDGTLLASSGEDRTVRLWEVESGRCLHLLHGHTNWVWSVTFSPNGALLASGSSDDEVKVWQVATGYCLRTLRNGAHPITALTFTHDGKRLISSSQEEMVKVWEVNSGECIGTVCGPSYANWIRSVTFNQDGSWLALGSNEKTVEIWKVGEEGSAHLFRTLSGHSGLVWSVAFNPGERLIASGVDDGSILLWEVQTGRCLDTLRSDQPYERMNIYGVTGITEAQRDSLKTLGAIEDGK